MKKLLSHFVAAVAGLVFMLALCGAIISLIAYFSGYHSETVKLILLVCAPVTLLGFLALWKSQKVREWFLFWFIPGV